ALVESFIVGTEVEVPLLGSPNLAALGLVGITINGKLVQGSDHLAADVVYGDSYGFTTLLAGLDQQAACRSALLAANALGIRDYGRVDLRVRPDGIPIFMEAS